MVATKSNLTVVVHTQLIFVTVFAHAKVLLCNRYLANTCLRFFHISNWSWNDLPKSLTNSVNLTLEVPSFSMNVKDQEMDEETVPDTGIPEESNHSNTTDPISAVI